MSEEVKERPLSRLVNDFGRLFASRSNQSELMNKNILRGISVIISEDPSSASKISQPRMALEDKKKRESLNRKLSLRPEPIDLKLRNIIKGLYI